MAQTVTCRKGIIPDCFRVSEGCILHVSLYENREAGLLALETKRAEAALSAILEKLKQPSEAMVRAADEVAGTINPIDGYYLALEAIRD